MRNDTSTAPLPATLIVSGASMAPTLPPGTRLRAEAVPPGAPLRHGEVLVLRSPSGWLVHRLLTVFGPGPSHVVHVGDAGGGLGVAPRGAVAGRVAGLDGGPLPEPRPDVRSRLHRARRRARLYVLLRGLARTLGGRRLAALGRGARDRLLRAGS